MHSLVALILLIPVVLRLITRIYEFTAVLAAEASGLVGLSAFRGQRWLASQPVGRPRCLSVRSGRR